MNLIHKKTDYAIHALCHMAKKKQKVSATELTKELKIAYPVLRGVLQVLKRNGMMRSLKGKNGGYTLALLPDKLVLTKVIRVFQGDLQLSRCIVNRNACRNLKSCQLRKKVDEIKTFAEKVFGSLTIASLS